MSQKIISTKAVGFGGQNGGSSTISSFVMSPITEVQVSRLFSSLNVQKSSLCVPNKLIKIAAEPLWKTPVHIYNHLITTGIGSNHFKSQLLPYALYPGYHAHIFFILSIAIRMQIDFSSHIYLIIILM